MRTLTILFVSCACAIACGGSDSSSLGTPNNGTSDPTGAPKGDDPKNGNDSNGAPSQQAKSNPAALEVVVNEVAAVGASEWIELVNKGSGAVDIGDYFVADSDKTTNEPKKKDAMRFPAGTTMQPGERILIMASKAQGTVGPHPKADCLPDGPETCFYATFGVSATSGEAIHLLAPDGAVVTSTSLPKSLSADAGGSTTETRCRLPDLTGDFATCAPTPGQPNHAP